MTEDRNCFEDLLGIEGRTMTVPEYERRSLDAVQNAWGECEYEKRTPDKYKPRACYIDDDGVLAALDHPRRTFITCYHHHPYGQHQATTPGQVALSFRRWLDNQERSARIRGVRKIRGF